MGLGEQVVFRTARDWYALDWDETQGLIGRLKVAAPRSGAAARIDADDDGDPVAFTQEEKRDTFKVITAWLAETDDASLSSELRGLRIELGNDLGVGLLPG